MGGRHGKKQDTLLINASVRLNIKEGAPFLGALFFKGSMRKSLTEKVIVNTFNGICNKDTGFNGRIDMPLYNYSDFECLFIAQQMRFGGTP